MNENNERGDQEEDVVESSEEQNPATEAEVEKQADDSQEEPVEALSEAEEDDFPMDPKAQKQAFYAMRKKIQELEQKDDEQEDDIDFVNLARGVTPTQAPSYEQTENVSYDESDPATRAFLSEVQRARQEANAAKREALAAKAQQEDFEAWQKYPQLNPKSNDRDKAFAKDVEAQYVLERNRSIALGKQPPRLVDVADKVQERYEQIRNQAKEQGAEEAKATMVKKEAATLEARGTSVGSMNVDPDRVEELRKKVRMGDISALTELNKLEDPYFKD